MQIQIQDWFDPKNEKHIKSYKYLKKNGHWKEGDVPENIEYSCNWQILLIQKLADCYLELHK